MSQLTEQRDWPVPNFNLAFPARNLYKFASPLRRGCEASAISSPRRDVDENQHMEGVMAETRAWTVERVEKRHIFQSSRFERTRVSNEFSVSLRAKNEDGEKYTGGYIVILRGRRPTCVKTYPINSMLRSYERRIGCRASISKEETIEIRDKFRESRCITSRLRQLLRVPWKDFFE